MGDGSPGLCERCAHLRRLTSARGSTFLLCERSRTQPSFPRYPRLPVLRCGGFEPSTRESKNIDS